MSYSEEQFKELDEAHALIEELKGLGPALYAVLTEAKADLEARYPFDLFWSNQNRQNLSRMINQRSAKLWSGAGAENWLLKGNSGYLHLRESRTGLMMKLRKADPVTKHVPHSNNTDASKVYFSQDRCLDKGKLSCIPQTDLFDEGRLIPDLGQIGLICVWSETTDGGIEITAYKTKRPGEYGRENEFFFRYFMPQDSAEYDDLHYSSDSLENDNLLPDLLDDLTDSDEQPAPVTMEPDNDGQGSTDASVPESKED